MSLNKEKLESDIFAAVSNSFNLSSIHDEKTKKIAEQTYKNLAKTLTTAINDYIVNAKFVQSGSM